MKNNNKKTLKLFHFDNNFALIMTMVRAIVVGSGKRQCFQ